MSFWCLCTSDNQSMEVLQDLIIEEMKVGGGHE